MGRPVHMLCLIMTSRHLEALSSASMRANESEAATEREREPSERRTEQTESRGGTRKSNQSQRWNAGQQTERGRRAVNGFEVVSVGRSVTSVWPSCDKFKVRNTLHLYGEYVANFHNQTSRFEGLCTIIRVTHQVVTNLPLTSKQKFSFGPARPGQARPKRNFCFEVNGRFVTT